MTARTLPPRIRMEVEAACARMAPDQAKVTAAVTEFRRHVGTDAYWLLLVDTLTVGVNTVHHYHAAECRKTICATCTAVRFATTAITAHQVATGWSPR